MYRTKAHDILSSSINSAIFIDENAKDFYSDSPVDTEVVEEVLSVNLFNTFKENGKSLTVHKFEKSNIEDDKIIDYLFNGRDLILLDWELDDVSGQEHSLNLLSKAIQLPYISFCCIYSRSANFNSIPSFLTAYFSGLTKDEIETESFPIDRFRDKSKSKLLELIHIAFNDKNFFFPEVEHTNQYEIIGSESNSFIINNTFVFLLKKEDEVDNDFHKLIEKISNEVIKNESSFFQLLGIEMQSVFNKNEKFIDETILKSSTDALFSFRTHLKNDKTFGIIIKKLLIEQAFLKLRTAKLKLLETEFLEDHSKSLSGQIRTEDLMQLNTFYNAVSVKGLNSDDIPNLNFGDIFKDQNNNYYLCITALCDCYYPNKIDHNFYFVKGKEFNDPETALKLGDTAFLSFLPDNKVVYWGSLEKPKLNKIKNLVLSESEDDPEKLKKDIELLKQRIGKLSYNQESLNNFLYKPFYVKPKLYNVENNKLVNNKIGIWDLTNKKKKEEFDQNINYTEVKYITTLRNDYTQRIANHAFGHPARVGVDFVKK